MAAVVENLKCGSWGVGIVAKFRSTSRSVRCFDNAGQQVWEAGIILGFWVAFLQFGSPICVGRKLLPKKGLCGEIFFSVLRSVRKGLLSQKTGTK